MVIGDRVFSGIAYVHGRASGKVIASDVALSFWGGVNPRTGEVIDRHHPLCGSYLETHVLAIPAGRGSCSGSGVIVELLLNGKGPRAMLFEREEDILTLGVVVAEEVFGKSIPVLTLSPDDFQMIANAKYVEISGSRITATDLDSASNRELSGPGQADHLFGEVQLSEMDQSFLAGNRGPAGQMAMRIILRMAQLQGAARLTDVSQVHVDGCIYTGPGSLAFAEKLRDLGGRVVVPTTLNSISVDQERWRSQGIDPALGEPASRLGDVYVEMGAQPTYTCTPYLLDTAPKEGEQIAWAESNAVVYANSVLGARTMKYPDFLDICIALTGRAPFTGPHIDHNRNAALRVNVTNVKEVDDSFYPLLGYHVGKLATDRIPLVVGLEHAAPSQDDLKAFGAAFATISSAPMFHIAGVTPEARSFAADMSIGRDVPTVGVAVHELDGAWEELNGAKDEHVDLVSLGNPHFSFGELQMLASLCHNRKKHLNVAVIIACGRSTYDKAKRAGLIAELEHFGVQFVTDTCWCMITDPVIPPVAKIIMTNSAKFAHYGPGVTGRSFHFGSLAECVNAACSGLHGKIRPGWMSRD